MQASIDTLLNAATGHQWQGSDFSWWQAVGATLVVFTLLLLCLRLLGRLQHLPQHHEASVLQVWPLGPRREIQVVRLHEDVHYVYRHENGLVVLKREDHATFAAAHPRTGQRTPAGVLSDLLRRGRRRQWLGGSPAPGHLAATAPKDRRST